MPRCLPRQVVIQPYGLRGDIAEQEALQVGYKVSGIKGPYVSRTASTSSNNLDSIHLIQLYLQLPVCVYYPLPSSSRHFFYILW